MSLRKLPELLCPEGLTGSAHITEKAARMFKRMEMPQAAEADGSDVISILDVIGYDFWTGDGVTAKRVGAALRQIGNKPVTVVINSPGGDFFEGVTIYNQLRAHPTKVTVQILAGVDLSPAIGVYSTQEEAERAMSEVGGLAVAVNRVMRKAGFQKTEDPKPGDVGLVVHNGKLCVAVHGGEFWFSHDESGLIGAPLSAVWKAWEI